MKEVINEVLDLKVPMLFYESVEEGDRAAGRSGAVLDECNKNLAYRGAYADARDLICNVAEELSGLPRKTKTLTDDKGEVRKDSEGNPLTEVDEKESIYVARVLASGKLSKEDLQAAVESRARGYRDSDGKDVAAIAVDIKQRERKAPKAKKLSATLIEAAKKLLGKADDGKISKQLSKYLEGDAAVFVRTSDEAKDVETLGWRIKAFQEAKLNAGDL